MNLGGIIAAALAALVIIAISWLWSPFYALAIVVAIVLVLALLLLFMSKTPPGRKLAEKLGRRVAGTRLGRRMAMAQVRAEAKRKGIPTTDAAGRQLSDFELQLEITDTPEARQLKKQLRTMNPQQRAQALRMLENQAAEAQRTGVAPQPVSPQALRPRVSGRPITKPPRASRKRRRR
jgi:hypothetical protein